MSWLYQMMLIFLVEMGMIGFFCAELLIGREFLLIILPMTLPITKLPLCDMVFQNITVR